MFCAECREERLTLARVCAICGNEMRERSTDEIATELSHVRFVLEEAKSWGRSIHAEAARNFVVERYERREKVLAQAAAGVNPEAFFAVPQAAAAAAPVAGLVEEEPIVDALPVDGPATSFNGVSTEAGPATSFGGAPVDAGASTPLRASGGAAALNSSTESSSAELAAATLEPGFDIPRGDPSREERIVDEVSTWRTVWKPFLYESIGWFIGAFLVVAGSVYFVALGWSAMSNVARGLTVFGLAAGYGVAFSVVGALLLRRPALAGAGRVVALIGSAMAPFAPLALGPVASEVPLLFWGLVGVWAFASAVLARYPSRAYDEPSVRVLQASTAAAVIGVAAAPLLASLGTGAVWVGAWTVLPVWFALRARGADARTTEQAVFALLAPIYLALVFLIRFHGAFAATAHPIPLATYAPFVALFLALGLRAWPRRDRIAAPLAIFTAAIQAVCLVAAGFGLAPAFFASAAIAFATSWWLAGNTRTGAKWLYPAYVTAYLAYQSCGQLVPGWLQTLLVRVRELLGYAAGAPLPFNWAAVYAVPFVLAGAVLALRRRANPKLEGAAEVLLRCTAGAVLFFSLEATFGADLRPAVWSVPVLAILALVLGVWVARPYLSWAAWASALLAPVGVAAVFGFAAAAAWAGTLALLFALTPLIADRLGKAVDAKHGHLVGAVLQTVLTAAFAWWVVDDHQPLAFAGLALAATASWFVSRWSKSELAAAWATVLSLSLAPFAAWLWLPKAVPLSLAIAAIFSAALLRTKSTPYLSVAAALVAVLAQVVSQSSGGAPLLTYVLLAAVATAAMSSLLVPWLGIFGALCWGAAIVPLDGRFESTLLQWLTAGHYDRYGHLVSVLLFAATAFGSSALTAARGRSPSTIAYALTAVLGAAWVSTGTSYGVEGPILLLAATTAALASRALRPEACLPFATLLAMVELEGDASTGRLAVAAILTVFALMDRLPRLREVLFGSRHAGLTAALCGLGVLTFHGLIPGHGAASSLGIVAASLLPVLWTLGTRQPAFLAAPVALGALFSVNFEAWALPLGGATTVATTQFAWRARALSARLFGTKVDHDGAALANWCLAGCVVGIAVVTASALGWGTFVASGAVWPLTVLALTALLLGGASLSERLMVAALACALQEPLRGIGSVAAAAFGFAALHADAGLRRILGAREQAHAEKVAGLAGVVLAFLALIDVPTWGVWALAPALAFAAAALLLGQRWLFAFSVVAAGYAVTFARPELLASLDEPIALLWATIAAALLAVLWRLPAVGSALERAVRRVSPEIDVALDAPLWAGAAFLLLTWVATRVLSIFPVSFEDSEKVLALAAGLLLWAVIATYEVVGASVLWTSVLAICLPPGWSGAAIALSGLVLALFGWAREKKLTAAVSLHHAGWALAATALVFLHGLGHPAFPIAVFFSLATVWTVVARNRSLEWVGWLATVGAAHLWMLHLGRIYSTGQGEEFILPYLSAACAVVASIAALLRSSPVRRQVALIAGSLATLEAAFGLFAISGGGVREAWAGVLGLGLLFGALVWAARRDDDEAPAFLAQVALLLAYLSVRLFAIGGALGSHDGLVALVGGAVFSGLHVLVRRHADLTKAFRRPALFGAYAFPLVGLLAAPWDQPLVASMMLVGYAAHFAVLAASGARRLASLVAAVAFNVALYLAWLGTHAGQAEYYVIPFGLSLLVLGRVFRSELSPAWQARLRAIAITTIYSAAAWRALLFTDGIALSICAAVCVFGVAAGIALRLRSFVYLGTGFLVTAVVANMVRQGLANPTIGALMLSGLGVAVVASMVLLTAKRAELIRRYERMRTMLAGWEP